MDYENGKNTLEKLAQNFQGDEITRNEATTRLHLIDQLFFECLGWAKDSCTSEESHKGEYADYTFDIGGKRVLIVEAKREGNYFELPHGHTKQKLSLKTLCDDYPKLKSAVEQVASYCQKRGVPLAVVCNGHQIVAFLATRSDGVAPLQGKAIVFDSFASMVTNFKDLWNFLSSKGVKQGDLARNLSGKQAAILPPKLSTSLDNYPGIKGRNPFQADIKIIADLILEDVIRNEKYETLFLTECYSPSGALSQYALISKEILSTRYKALFEKDTMDLALVPAVERTGVSVELLAESLSRRPILLIGDVGVGKTTFIKNLVRIEAKEIFDDAIVLYFDLGAQAALSIDLKQFVLAEIERQLLQKYEIDVDERNFVRGVYNLELERFRKGIYGELRENNLSAFKERELEFLEEKVSIRDQHLKAAIEHLAKARRKQVVVFIDNADQRTDDIQQQAFLVAQEIATNWSATVFAALRPETFHNSLRSGTLSGYHPKAFTISPPRIDRVVQKRLAFASKLARGEYPIYGLPVRTRVNFESLAKLIKIFQDSLNFNNDLMESIENISGGNVREAIEFVTNFFSSGHVDTQKIIRIYNEQGTYYVPLHEFLHAVIYRDAAFYDPKQSPITNLFDLDSPDPKEHFLLPFFIEVVLLLSEQKAEAGFVEAERVYKHIQNYGFTADQISWVVGQGHRGRLIELAGSSDDYMEIDQPKAIRVTTVGAYHLRLIKMFPYIDAIIVDTPILQRDFRDQLNYAQSLDERLQRAEIFIQYLDLKWQESSLGYEIFNWEAASAQVKSEIRGISIKNRSKRDLGNY